MSEELAVIACAGDAFGSAITAVLIDGEDAGAGRTLVADEVRGQVQVTKIDTDGCPYVEPDTDEIATEWREGRVEIVGLTDADRLEHRELYADRYAEVDAA